MPVPVGRDDSKGLGPKSQSFEPLFPNSPLSEPDSPGGVRLDESSISLSPTPKRLVRRRPIIGGARKEHTENSSSFQVGSSAGDDVFTDDSSSASASKASPKGKQVVVASEATVPVDPQSCYTPGACIFVANLPAAFDNATLEHALVKHFSKWGIVYVKLGRDERHMPYSFCQFTEEAHARNAEKYDKNADILGRPCRIEMARAHSNFIVYRKDGETITFAEATTALEQYGKIGKVDILGESLRAFHRIPPAVVVTYKMWDPTRQVLRSFQDNPDIGVIPYDPKVLEVGKSNRSRASDTREEVLQYRKDARSVFFGNLPLDTTKATLAGWASACGEVVDVQIFDKPLPGNSGIRNCFGFVEFSRIDSPDNAVQAWNGKELNGRLIKVQRKRARIFETPSRSLVPSSESQSHTTFPRRRSGGYFASNRGSIRFTTPTAGSIAHSGLGGNSSESPQRRWVTSIQSGNADSGPSGVQMGQPESISEVGPSTRAMGLPETNSGGNSSMGFKPAETPSNFLKTQKVPKAGRVAASDASSGDADSEKSSSPIKTQRTSSKKKPKAKEQKPTPVVEQEMAPPMPTTVPLQWMPQYPNYAYPPMAPFMSTPMTPQSPATMMYGGYMPYPIYPDAYGNMVYHPAPPIAPYTGSHLSNTTPARSGSEEEKIASAKSKGKGKEVAE